MTTDPTHSKTPNQATDRSFAIISCVTVVAGAIAGFWLLGSPGQQRLIGLDRERIQELKAITWQITDRSRASDVDEVVPAELHPSQMSLDDFRDPVTDEPYGYRRLSDTTYELCATFDTDSKAQLNRNARDDEAWQHPAGRHCFEIDAKNSQPVLRPFQSQL